MRRVLQMTQKEYKEYNGDKRRMQMARMVADMVFSEFEIRLDEERERMAKVIADTMAHQVELKMNQQSMRHNCVKRPIYYTPSLLFCQYFVMEAAN